MEARQENNIRIVIDLTLEEAIEFSKALDYALGVGARPAKKDHQRRLESLTKVADALEDLELK